MEEKGLYLKYFIKRNDGKSISEDAQFFVLRIDQDAKDGEIAREVLRLYAEKCENRTLGRELYRSILNIECNLEEKKE